MTAEILSKTAAKSIQSNLLQRSCQLTYLLSQSSTSTVIHQSKKLDPNVI